MDSKDPKQVAIVTGPNTGIGRETALSLAIDGMKLFMACRSVDRGHAAASYIREACPGADVEVLGTLESVRKCATDFKSRNLPLKLLINNADVCSKTPWHTAEGVGGSTPDIILSISCLCYHGLIPQCLDWEVLQVNHLGHYLLTRLLEDSLVAGAPSRVLNVSSIMSREFKFRDPRGYSGEILQRFQSWRLFALQAFKRVCLPLNCNGDGKGKGFKHAQWIQVAFAPTWDGAMSVYRAAATLLKTGHEKTPFRLFARGRFA